MYIRKYYMTEFNRQYQFRHNVGYHQGTDVPYLDKKYYIGYVNFLKNVNLQKYFSVNP